MYKKTSTIDAHQKPSAYQNASSGGRNIKVAGATIREQVTVDKKAYKDIMSYLIKLECKRLEKDRTGHPLKRPQSGLTGPRSKEAIARKTAPIGSRLKVNKTPTKQSGKAQFLASNKDLNPYSQQE